MKEIEINIEEDNNTQRSPQELYAELLIEYFRNSVSINKLISKHLLNENYEECSKLKSKQKKLRLTSIELIHFLAPEEEGLESVFDDIEKFADEYYPVQPI